MSRKISSFLTVVFLLYLSPTLIAESQLTISKEFNIISVNGKAQTHNLSSNSSLLKLNSGLNKIAISYESIFKSKAEHFETIKSNIFVVSFYLPSDGRYRLLHLKQANLKAARMFIQDPQINIIDQQGKNIKSKQFFPASQSIDLIHQSTKKNIEIQQPIRLVSKKPSNTNQEKNIPKEDAEVMLLFWWQQASTQQRESFLETISQTK